MEFPHTLGPRFGHGESPWLVALAPGLGHGCGQRRGDAGPMLNRVGGKAIWDVYHQQ